MTAPNTPDPQPEERVEMKDAGCLARMSDAMHRAFVGGFDWLTDKTTAYPWVTILVVVLLSIALAQGAWLYDEELSPEKQFTPRDTQAVRDEQWVLQNFGHLPQQMTGYFVSKSSTPGVLGKDALLYMLAYHKWVTTDAHGTLAGQRYDYNYSCARYSADGCQEVASVLQLWDYDEARVQADADPLATINRPGAWRAASPSGPELDYFLNDVKRDSAGRITGAGGARMQFLVQYPTRKVSGEGDINPEVDAFQLAVSDGTYDAAWKPPTNTDLQTYVFTNADQEREESKAIESDVMKLILGYCLLIVFAVLVLARFRVKYSHAALAFLTVLSVALSTISSYGLCWFIGIPFNNVVQVLILVLLGLGVDDAFIIMYSWWDCAETVDMKERLVMAMRHAGPAILLTSLTDLVAFLVGSSSDLPALRDFCFYATFGIFFDFLYQVTFFVACVFLASKRQERGKADCCCCVSVTDDSGCCLGDTKVGVDWRESDPGTFRRFFGVHLPRATLSAPGRVVVILAAMAFVSVGIYGVAAEIKMNFDNAWFIPGDSRLQDVLDVRDSFGGRSVPGYWWAGEFDYANKQVEVEDDMAVLASVNTRYVVNGSLSVWLFDFQDWVKVHRGAHAAPTTVNGKQYDVVAPGEFYRLLKEWADVKTGPEATWYHIDNLRWKDDAKTALKAVRYTFLVKEEPFGDGNVAIDALHELRRLGRATQSGVFPWAKYFVFWEGYDILMDEMIRNVGIAAACVFVLVALVTANLGLSCAILLNVALIDVCILGWMPIVGVDVNSVSIICVVLAVGLVVDYSVHIAGDFVKVKSDDATTPDTHGLSHGQLRAAHALYTMAPGVGAGGFSTFLAVLPLAIADSYVFTVFFRMFCLIIGFGLFFGMAVLPVAFSFINPPADLGAAAVTAKPGFMPLEDFCLLNDGGAGPENKKGGATEPVTA
eukprot:TRINITY_DN1959_c0_g4_i1.p1 TRINITY_DN1959_c0_g4~~TRINITY_DN1959_c0_g4_i1.p1  ORF type:complete len:939 (+),score=334.49 TRINITY_DN1959_c0_g4_i1:41-2857(+)